MKQQRSSFILPSFVLFHLPEHYFFSSSAVNIKASFILYTVFASGQVNISVLFKGDIFYKGQEEKRRRCDCQTFLFASREVCPLFVHSKCSLLLRELRYRCDKLLCLKVQVSAKSVVLEERIRASVTHMIHICWIRAERGEGRN